MQFLPPPPPRSAVAEPSPDGPPLRRARRIRASAMAGLASLGLLAAGASPAAAEPVGVPPADFTGGEVVAWGDNSDNQSSVPVAATSGVVAVAAGGTHSLAIKTDGSVLAWGDDSDGQSTVPAGASSGVTAIAAGQWHSLALKNGSVLAWGNDGWGQSTVPAGASSSVTAIAAGQTHSVALRSDGSVIQWGGSSGPLPAEVSSGVDAIAAGNDHDLALKDGAVLAWGMDNAGQSTVPLAAQSGVVAVAAGGNHSLALLGDGSVIAWGSNSAGQSAVPVAAQSGVAAIAAADGFSLATKDDGTLVVWGKSLLRTVPTGAAAGAVAVAGGVAHALALVEAVAPVFTGDAPPASAVVGTPYSYTFTATGPPSPTFTVSSGSLPAGLSLDPVTGVLSGTPTTGGTATFTVTASNGKAPAAVGASHTVTVIPFGAPQSVQATAADSQVRVAWQAPTTGGTVDHYRVTATPGQASCTTTRLTCVLGGQAGQTYQITVTPVDPGGLTGPTGTATSTAVDAPPVPDTPPAGAEPTLTTTDGPLSTVEPGQQITLVGTGFLPHSTVRIVVHSTPRTLASALADAGGNLIAPVTLPDDLEPGQHSLLAYGVDSDGLAHALRMDVTVPQVAGDGRTGGLAYTGAGPVVPLTLTAITLLVAGALSMTAARRRHPS